jgi:hypothetical protein
MEENKKKEEEKKWRILQFCVTTVRSGDTS